VDIPAAYAAKFSFPKRAEEKTIAPTRLSSTFPRSFLTHVYPAQSPTILFFNCTKNTELTAFTFARTVTFAPTKKLKIKKRDAAVRGTAISVRGVLSQPAKFNCQKSSRIGAP